MKFLWIEFHGLDLKIDNLIITKLIDEETTPSLCVQCVCVCVYMNAGIKL